MAVAKEDLPEPLVPEHIILDTFEWMPLYGDKLRRSEHNGTVSDAEYRASMNLWWTSWKETPAASLPADDRLLAAAADLARNMPGWRKVKGYAMRNFVLCADGRYYHTFLAPLAIKAYAQKVASEKRAKAGADGRWKNHAKKGPRPRTRQPVDNNASRTGKDASSNASRITNDAPSNATSIEKNAERELYLQPVSLVRTTGVPAVDNFQPQDENSKSEQRATEDTPPSGTRGSGVPEHLRKYLREFTPPEPEDGPK